MKTETPAVCGLCFKISNFANYQVLEEILMMLEVLNVLKSNLAEIEDPVICSMCVDKVKAAFHFKAACIEAENNRISSKPTHILDKAHSENMRECRLCTNFVGKNSVLLLSERLKEDGMIEAFQKYIVDIDSDATKNALLCESCETSLRNFSDFVYLISHFESENEENKYIDQFLNIEDLNKTGVLKDNTDSKITETKIKTEVMIDDDFYTLETKPKIECNAAFNDIDTTEKCNYSFDIKKMSVSDDDNTYSDMYKEVLDGYAEFQEKNEEIDIKIDPEQSASGGSGIENTLKPTTHRTEHLHLKEQAQSHKNDNEQQSYTTHKCQQCRYKTKFKHNFIKHVVSHKNSDGMGMFKCQYCTFHTKYKSSLTIHTLTHKSVDEVEVHKCQQCPYQTTFKGYLIKHTISHKNSDEIEMFKCQHCTFRTKYKNSLKGHTLTHKTFDEVEMHKCQQCTYQTKFTHHLIEHLLSHKHPDEIDMFKCQHCTFQTRYKNSLRRHMLTHKSFSELEVYKCQRCPYKTKFKRNLNGHMIIHKNSDEVEIFRCQHCNFHTKYRKSLKSHIVTHKSLEELEMHECQQCSYKTKFKCNLKVHMITHKNTDEIEMFKCQHCTFETKHKKYIKVHALTHKRFDEVEMFICQHCTFQTKHKKYLKVHELTHTNFNEVNIQK